MPIAVALVAHGIGIGGEFVADDIPDIVEHPIVGGGESLAGLLDYNYMGEPRGQGANTLRPLATLELAIEWRLFGNRPAVFHLITLAWFVLLVLAVQRTLRRLVSETAAVWGAALFAAMAIHVDAVAMTANRPEVCSLALALFALGSALDGKGVRSVVLYLAAVLYKESAFLTPAVIAWWLISTEGIAALAWRRRGRVVLALAFAAATFFAARSALLSVDIEAFILPADNPLLGESLAVRSWMPMVLLGEYLQLSFAPIDLAFDYTYAAIPVDANLGRLSGWLGLLFASLLTAIVALRLRRGERAGTTLRNLAAVAGGFALSYALFSNSVLLIVTLFAERLFLAPSFFLVAGLTCAAVAVVPRIEARGVRQLLAIGAALFIALQVLLAAQRTVETSNSRTLLAAQVEAQPDSVKGHLYYARELGRAGEYEEAVWHLAIATAGRNRFPRPFVAPRLAGAPIAERYAALPELLAPGDPPTAFWPAFRAFAVRRLGAGAGLAIDRVAGYSARP